MAIKATFDCLRKFRETQRLFLGVIIGERALSPVLLVYAGADAALRSLSHIPVRAWQRTDR